MVHGEALSALAVVDLLVVDGAERADSTVSIGLKCVRGALTTDSIEISAISVPAQTFSIGSRNFVGAAQKDTLATDIVPSFWASGAHSVILKVRFDADTVAVGVDCVRFLT